MRNYVNAGRSITVEIPFGSVLDLEVEGTGSAVRLRSPGGGDPYSPVTLTSNKVLGPYDSLTYYRINVRSGRVGYLVRPYVVTDESPPTWTGWGDYVNGEYTEASPLQPAVGQWTLVDWDNVTVRDSQKPLDVETLFDLTTSGITGRNGDGLMCAVELIGKPTTNNPTYVDFAIDIGGAIGRIYPQEFSFPRGQGVARPRTIPFPPYTLDTWEANTGRIAVNPNAGIDLYGFRVVVHRTHKAR